MEQVIVNYIGRWLTTVVLHGSTVERTNRIVVAASSLLGPKKDGDNDGRAWRNFRRAMMTLAQDIIVNIRECEANGCLNSSSSMLCLSSYEYKGKLELLEYDLTNQ